MSSLLLTLSPDEPLVIGDADAVVNIIRTEGKYVKVRVDADKKTQINRGSIYIGKKLVPEYDYINTPLINLWKENSELMSELLEQTANELHLENVDYDNLPEKTKRIFAMVSPKLYMKVIELFLAKFLYVHQLEFTREAVELFTSDFLKGNGV